MVTHSSTLALEIPWTGELGAGYYPWDLKESGMTERLNFTPLTSQLNIIQPNIPVTSAESQKFSSCG